MNELQVIQNMIHEVRGQQVMLDSDLAQLYGVETSQLKRAVRRNLKRFEGDDFMFVLSLAEAEELRSRCQTGILNSRGTNVKYAPFAFTELGVAMLSSVLHSDAAIEINRKIMRAFVMLRHFMDMTHAGYNELKKEVSDIHVYIEELLSDQNDINEDTQAQLTAINQALAELSVSRRADDKPRRPIGFIQHDAL